MDSREEMDRSALPDVNNGASGAVPTYFPSMSGDVEQTATSDQLRKRRPTTIPRPARSDGDSAISGEHSDGREGFTQLGDTGATSQDRTVCNRQKQGGGGLRVCCSLFRVSSLAARVFFVLLVPREGRCWLPGASLSVQ
jgi:hypothetical protein